jgi:sorting nexin-8
VEETITVTTIAEKEGMFMFQHRNYEVTSARRNSKVIRRYSDFVWLLDCLHKRYPFRQLPLLPPKRVASKYFPGYTMILIEESLSQWQLLSGGC